MHHIVRRAARPGWPSPPACRSAMAVPAAAQPAAPRRTSGACPLTTPCAWRSSRTSASRSSGSILRSRTPRYPQARGGWVPTLTSTLQDNRSNTPATNLFAAARTTSSARRSRPRSACIRRCRPAPTTPSHGTAPATRPRTFSTATTRRLSSSVSLSVTQPLLRNFKIDDIRRQLDSQQDRSRRGRHEPRFGDRADDAQREECVLGSHVSDRQPEGAAAVARSGQAAAVRQREARRRSAPWRRSTS